MKPTPFLRSLTRAGAVVIGGTFAVLIGVQYARIIERNVDYMQQVRDVERRRGRAANEARRATSPD